MQKVWSLLLKAAEGCSPHIRQVNCIQHLSQLKLVRRGKKFFFLYEIFANIQVSQAIAFQKCGLFIGKTFHVYIYKIFLVVFF